MGIKSKNQGCAATNSAKDGWLRTVPGTAVKYSARIGRSGTVLGMGEEQCQ
jgi:hypothetical protein